MKNMMKRCFAVMMVLVLCLSLLPVSAFAADNGTCPKCGGTDIVQEKKGYVCRTCDDYTDPIFNKEPEPEPTPEPEETEKHEHQYDESGKCVCGEQKPEPECVHEKTYAVDNKNGTHTLICTSCNQPVETKDHSYVNGTCDCGAQEPKHEHSWKYTPDYYNYFTHVKICSACGETVTEKCTEDTVFDPWQGAYVKKCTLCNYWTGPVHTHDWAVKANEDGTHTYTCTDPTCGDVHTEECRLKASADATSVTCEICGWVKYNDGTPGIDNTCEHVFGTSGTNNGEYSHELTCIKCQAKKTEACKQGELKDENGKIVSHYCTVCGKTTPVIGENYCDDWKDHKWETKKEVLSEDGESVLTTQICSKCGAVNITDICNSPAKVTVHYVYKDTGEEFASERQSVIKGMYYKFESPKAEREGYEPDRQVVANYSNGKDDDIYVYYTKVTPAPTLTIHYHYADGPKAGTNVADDYVAQVKAFDEYSVKSPAAPLGYCIEEGRETVTGKMGQSNTEETVKYSLVKYFWAIKYVDENDKELSDISMTDYTVETVNGLTAPANPTVRGYEVKIEDVTKPDPLQLGNVVGKVVYAPIEYKWTINYVDENGNPMEGMPSKVTTFDITSIKTLEGVESPTKSGYTTEQTFVEAPTELGDVTVNVVYSLSNAFNLTVVHRYVELDGTVREETKVLGQYKIGDTYTTEPENEEGYTLSATPDNASGTFGDADVTVIYEYTAVETDEPEQPEIPDSRPPEERPEERPEEPEEPDPEDPLPPVPPEEPEQPETPVTPVQPETPVTPDPVEIDEPQVPLVEAPELPEEPIVVDEPQIPLVEQPEVPEEVEIEDPEVPLADVPQTGDVSGAWLAGATLPAAALGLICCLKKRESEEN